MTLFFLKKTITSLSISALSFASIIYSCFYASNQRAQIKELEQRLLFLNRQAVRSQEAEVLIKAHEKDFAAFQKCKFEDLLNPEKLQKSTPYAIEFGNIASLNADSKNKGLVSQDLYFSIPCLQDQDIFIFLDHLFNEGPGFFQVHEVTIHRIRALSEEMLEKIAAGKPQTLFDGKVTATWVHH
jgi:hypothetical protein